MWGVFISDTSRAAFNLMRGAFLTHRVQALLCMQGVSLTHPVLASYFVCFYSFEECLLHFLCLFPFFYRESFSYRSRAGCVFIWGVSLTYPGLALILSGDFYTTHAFFIFIEGVSVSQPMPTLFLCGEFFLHIPCCLHFYAGSFSYTSRAGFIMYARTFSDTSRVGFVVLFVFIHLRSFSYTSHAGFFLFFFIFFFFFFFFLTWEFLLHNPSWVCFYLGSFYYTSRAGFIFNSGVSLTHPVLAIILSGDFLLHTPCHFEFLLHIPCWLHFYLESLDISCAGLIFMGKILLHIPCWLWFYVGSLS